MFPNAFHIVFSNDDPRMILTFLNILLTLCIRENPKRVLFANNEDPDEIQHKAAVHRSLYSL